ncbi:hypothetical protein, partial [Streptomyces sp. ADI96-02]|uniref:hypothetical protein n=1 Tax=Streptomyces sp. ADI96-02 TaxID=1522760 RepID=UPI0019D04D09
VGLKKAPEAARKIGSKFQTWKAGKGGSVLTEVDTAHGSGSSSAKFNSDVPRNPAHSATEYEMIDMGNIKPEHIKQYRTLNNQPDAFSPNGPQIFKGQVNEAAYHWGIGGNKSTIWREMFTPDGWVKVKNSPIPLPKYVIARDGRGYVYVDKAKRVAKDEHHLAVWTRS